MINWSSISLLDLAGYLSSTLKKRGIDTILVGGACVTIYSNARYQSYDLDFITYDEMKKVRLVLKELGFVEKQKYFIHAKCRWFVEFVSPPVAVGNEPIHQFNTVKSKLGTIKLLRPEDSVKDRLASFYYWKDKQGLNQAIDICLEQNVNLKEIESWSIEEKQVEKFKIFKDSFGHAKKMITKQKKQNLKRLPN